jgi:hypothetical protein
MVISSYGTFCKPPIDLKTQARGAACCERSEAGSAAFISVMTKFESSRFEWDSMTAFALLPPILPSAQAA